MSKLAVIAAGGTGGHLFPAQALAEALIARGWRIVLASDDRVEQHVASFPAQEHIALSARTFRRGDLIGMGRAAFALLQGMMQARAAFRRLQPDIVVGFGGYPSAPSILAAASLGLPTLLHEQNAVMGRANRFLAPFVRRVACAFPVLQKAPAKLTPVVVGNPVRPPIQALYRLPYEPPTEDGPLRILVTGGSQGARLLSELTPEAIRKLPEAIRMRLKVWQQARPESMENARKLYADAMVEAEVAPFFRDMAGRLAQAHLVIGRSGSGSVNEFAVAGRPAILIPLAIALDDDQGQNGKVMADAGGAVMIREKNLTVDTLRETLEALLPHPGRLAKMSDAARSIARPDAAERLADVVVQTAR